MDQNSTFPSKSERKMIEKNRRDEMKALYYKLCSLVPHQSSKEVVSMSDQLEEAANYIKKLQERLEVMKKQKKKMLKKVRKYADDHLSSSGSDGGGGPRRIEVHNYAKGSTDLDTGLKHEYYYHLFKETVGILHEEGADVVSASFSVVDQAVFHTLCYEIRGGSGLECEAARISERLNKFVADDDN